MPFKKIDFTLTYHEDNIYVICGKDSSNEIVDSCEVYNTKFNKWKIISPVNQKRYAASAITMQELHRIFLFGGRSDHQNLMTKIIEEYDIKTNIWKIVNI